MAEWQTRYFEGVVNVSSYGFKSHRPHQTDIIRTHFLWEMGPDDLFFGEFRPLVFPAKENAGLHFSRGRILRKMIVWIQKQRAVV